MRSPLSPAALSDVTINGGFWHDRQHTNRTVTLPLQYERAGERINAMKLDWKPGGRKPKPHCFWDSDVAKWIEAAAYSLATHPDKALERKVDRVIGLIAKAQAPDGYINSYYRQVEPDKRWTNLRDMHELYTIGHLIEAAVAYHQATGKDRFLKIMRRCADHVDRKLGPKRGQLRGYPGHQEIELALVRLYRATREHRYLDLARFFIDERGRQPLYFHAEAKRRGGKPQDALYEQAHLPVREQKDAVGHAVRALYMYSGMADVAAETDDQHLLAACKRLWKSVTARRMYLTGGVGSTPVGEKFTSDYDLPNEGAYAETCAAIALVFFAQRMLHATRDGAYADVMERCLYNGTISGVSLAGDRFFYDNVLASHPPRQAMVGRRNAQRCAWFGCACCPPNIARLLASLGQYVYATGGKTLFVHHYVSSTFKTQVAGGDVEVTQRTGYPWKEQVELKVRMDKPVAFTLALRIPAWCKQATLEVNGKREAFSRITRKGYAYLKRTWASGDQVTLTLAMEPFRVAAHPRVRHDAGCVALQRGPVVYCLEQVDNGPDLKAIVLPRDAKITARHKKDLLGGVTVLTADATRVDDRGWNDQLYRPAATPRTKRCRITAVPYYAWSHRDPEGEPGEMITWVRSGA